MNILLFNLPTASHLLIGLYFAFFGCWNIYHWVPIMKTMAEDNIPHPYLLLPLAIGLQIVTGCMIIFSIFPQLAAVLLMPFTVFSVFIFHPFWRFTGELRILNFTIFMTNMTVTLGALFSLLVY